MDASLDTTNASDIGKLLLMASLANVTNPVLGLAIPEVVAFLCAPGRDVTRVKETLMKLN